MTLKLGITCVGNGIEENSNRKGNDPSPTTVGADLSRFNNDIPLESDPPSFDNKPVECGDGVVSPKKGKAISAVICCILLYGVSNNIIGPSVNATKSVSTRLWISTASK